MPSPTTRSPSRAPRLGVVGVAAFALVVTLSVTTSGAFAQVPPEGRTQVPAASAGDYQHELAPRATASRATGSIEVDGRLDESVWSQAVPITSFIQELPNEGQAPTQRSEFRIAYDDDAIYVGAMLYDDGALTPRMTRRDAGQGDFDYFTIAFDSFHDHETSYQFSVAVSGSYRDAIAGGGGGGGGDGGGGGRGGGGGDSSWDPVWTRAIQVRADGWSAEMRVPFSQLRFAPGDAQVWGIRINRQVHRLQERTVFPFVPTLDRGGPSRYAHLDGLSGIQPGRRLELLPYATARGEYLNLVTPSGVTFSNPYRSGSDEFWDFGADFKYRLTSNVTLDATVNPDFGQVELDPSVINLSDFETRYEERRPFFVEGADIFNFGEGGPMGSTGRPPQLLYSRRIGRAPQGSVPSSAIFSDAGTTTTILGAAKVTGRTAGGWSLGFLEALTGEETARTINASQLRGESVIEPMTNYVVGRARRQVNGGNTRFGAIGASVNRSLSGTGLDGRLHSAAYSGGVDFTHEWSNRTYRFSSAFTASYVEGDPAAMLRTQRSSTRYYQRPDAWHLDLDANARSLTGYYFMFDMVKQAGAFTAKTAMSFSSPAYEVNDLGFQSASDRIMFDTNFQYQDPVPGRFFRNWNTRMSPDFTLNYAGDWVHREINGNLNFTFLNYWGIGGRLAYNPRNDDDRLTRGGPIAKTPQRWSGTANLNSDSRREIIARFNYDWSTDEAGGWHHDFGLNLTANPTDQVTIRLGPSYRHQVNSAQYVTGVDDALATSTFGRRYLFANLDQTTLSLETRLDVTLTPAISLQLYVEPFISTGDYEGLKEFERRRTFAFFEYGVEGGSTVTQGSNGDYTVDPDGAGGPAGQFNVGNRDFSYRSLLGNAVLRWEWREGSTLYLVWQQRRIDSLTNRGPNGTDTWVGDFDLGRDVGDMFGASADNIFAIKVNYWLNP